MSLTDPQPGEWFVAENGDEYGILQRVRSIVSWQRIRRDHGRVIGSKSSLAFPLASWRNLATELKMKEIMK